jgi:hypothetical protein
MDITLPTFRKHYFSLVKRLRSIARDRLDAAYRDAPLETSAGRQRRRDAAVDGVHAEQRSHGCGGSSMAAAPADKLPEARLGKKVVDEQRAIDADADLMAELDQEATAQDAARH